MGGDGDERIALLERTLTRAAEAIGDLNEPVMDRYYSLYPEAKEAFEHHGYGKRRRLEADMIDFILYALMTWLERPSEVSFILYDSVPHHSRTLNVKTNWFYGLIDAVIDTILESVPPEEIMELALLKDIRRELHAAIAAAVTEYRLE